MERFLTRYEDRIVGTKTGFDRILFRGTARSISYCQGAEIFLSCQRVLYKDFAEFSQRITQEICQHAEVLAAAQGRPHEYLSSPAQSQEDRAREIMERDQISKGLICVLAAVEPCQTITVRGDREAKRLRLRSESRQCKHLYFYFADRDFGLMHIRLQTWFPYTMQVCVNGRLWLANQLQRAGIAFVQHDNTFTHIAGLPPAQKLLDQLAKRDFSKMLHKLTQAVNPLERHPEWNLHGYYWSFRQVEVATDVMFRDPESLAAIYPRLLEHAMLVWKSEDMLRFLGRRINSRFNGEIQTNLKRYEGLRIKHWVQENSIKMYDKGACVLRIETTINNPHRFQAYRNVTRQGHRRKGWTRLRKGVADTARLVQIARAANERYLQALAVVGETKPSHRILDPVSQPVKERDRRFRALQPIGPHDSRLFAAIYQGQFFLNGFRNKDLCAYLSPPEGFDHRRFSLRLGRMLSLLRAHGLIFRVAKTQIYRITKKGHEVMSTALKFRDSDIALLAA